MHHLRRETILFSFTRVLQLVAFSSAFAEADFASNDRIAKGRCPAVAWRSLIHDRARGYLPAFGTSWDERAQPLSPIPHPGRYPRREITSGERGRPGLSCCIAGRRLERATRIERATLTLASGAFCVPGRPML